MNSERVGGRFCVLANDKDRVRHSIYLVTCNWIFVVMTRCNGFNRRLEFTRPVLHQVVPCVNWSSRKIKNKIGFNSNH